jgi:hypothetical protein
MQHAPPPIILTPERLRIAAASWCVIWPVLLAVHLVRQLRVGWTDGIDRPFGEDFLNFWSGAQMAITGRVLSIYDMAAFHDFQVAVVGNAIDLYHFSYPPTLLALIAPFALFPYPLAWAVWQIGGWATFAAALRAWGFKRGWFLAFAWPAVFVNAVSGQAGAWIAAIVGWGLILLPRRPVLSGVILSVLTVKPQLFWLIPIAFMAGREWRALAGLAVGAALILLSSLMFGIEAWTAYATQAAVLKRVILEDGSGVWHRMISVFVLVRHSGGSVSLAYVVQIAASMIAATFVATAWYRGNAARAPLLIVGLLTGAVYVSDYDCVMLAFPAAWAWSRANQRQRIAIGMAALVPMVAAPVASATHFAFGAVILWPLLIVLARYARHEKSERLAT